MEEELERLRRRVAELEKSARGLDEEGPARGMPDHLKLLNAVPDIVYGLDQDGLFTFLNESVRMLDYEPSDLIGKHFTAIIHPDESACVARRYVLPGYAGLKNTGGRDAPRLFDERRSGQRKTRDLVVRLVSKDSAEVSTEGGPGRDNPEETVITADICAAGLYDDKGNFIGTIGVIRDITERSCRDKEVKTRLNRIEKVVRGSDAGPRRQGGIDGGGRDPAYANEFLRKVMDGAANAIFALDLSGRMMLVNEGLVKISGYCMEELIDRDFLTLFDPAGAAGLIERFKKAVACGLPVSGLETVLVRHDGVSRIVSFGMSPLVRGDDITCIVCTAEDVTERKMAEELLREKTGQLEQLNLHLMERVEEETRKRIEHEHLLIHGHRRLP